MDFIISKVHLKEIISFSGAYGSHNIEFHLGETEGRPIYEFRKIHFKDLWDKEEKIFIDDVPYNYKIDYLDEVNHIVWVWK